MPHWLPATDRANHRQGAGSADRNLAAWLRLSSASGARRSLDRRQEDGRPKGQDNGIAIGLVHDSRSRRGLHHNPGHHLQKRRAGMAIRLAYLQLPAFLNPAASASDSELNVIWFFAATLS